MVLYSGAEPMTLLSVPLSVKTQITAFPKNTEMPSCYHKWMSKYAFVGINSEGLVGDAQYLEECSWDTEENLKSAA